MKNMRGLEKKIQEQIKQNKEGMDNKIDKLKPEIQQFREDNENLIRKIEKVIDNNSEEVGSEKI